MFLHANESLTYDRLKRPHMAYVESHQNARGKTALTILRSGNGFVNTWRNYAGRSMSPAIFYIVRGFHLERLDNRREYVNRTYAETCNITNW